MSKQQLITLSNYYLTRALELDRQMSDLVWRGQRVPAQLQANHLALWDKKNALKARAVQS